MEKKKEEKEEIDINLEDEDVIGAALKIQSHYKKKMNMIQNKKYGERNEQVTLYASTYLKQLRDV